MNYVERLRDELKRKPRPLRILGASGQLGYGIPTATFERGLARKPDMIGCDMGSVDIGPSSLGSGQVGTTPASTVRDLRKVLLGARSIGVPLVIGTAGSAGAGPHLDATLAIVRRVAQEEGLHFRLASIRADIDPAIVKAAIADRRVRIFDDGEELQANEVEAASHIVGQMGYSSFIRAYEAGADVIIAGRSCDTAIFASLPIMLGYPRGLSMHLAKIVECAWLCCVPGGGVPLLASLDQEGFELESMAEQRRATPSSVAAHSLYEQSDPFYVYEPEGRLDVTEARYEAIDERRARVSGASWQDASRYSVKLEGAKTMGFRAVLLAGVTDPRFIARQEQIFSEVKEVVRNLACEDAPEDYDLFFRFYGVNGVLDHRPVPQPAEAFVLGECLAPTPERALEVMRTTKQYLLHHGYPGRLSTGGNLAFPFTPPEISVGPAYCFNIYHLMEVDDLESLFPVSVDDV
jgi:hypothetical protein